MIKIHIHVEIKKFIIINYGPFATLKNGMEMPGFEPGAFHMRSERATTALHPLFLYSKQLFLQNKI